MSYSFSVKAPTKDAAKAAVAAHFDAQVIAYQPVHAADRAAALANANTVIDLLADAPAMDIVVSCNGYVSWRAEGEFTSAQVSAGANLVARE